MDANKNVLTRSFALIGSIDLVVSVQLVFVLGSIDLVSVPILIGLMAVRMLAWIVDLFFILRSVRAWQQDPDTLEETELRKADHALGTVGRRFIMGYAAGWTVGMPLAIVTGTQGMGGLALLGAGLFVGGLVPIVSAIIHPLLAFSLLQLRLELTGQLRDRQILVHRVPGSFTRRQIMVGLALSWGVVVTMLGLGLMVHADALQAEASAELRGDVALAAAHLEAGRDPSRPPDNFAVVTTDQLPSVLAETVLTHDPTEPAPVVAADPSSGQILAAAPLPDGRWAFGTQTVDEQLHLVVLFVVLFVAATPFAGGVAHWALARLTSLPLARLSDAAKSLATDGKVRSLRRLGALHDDELGDLVVNFNKVLDVFDELATAATTVAKGDLRVQIDQPGDLQDAFRAMLAQLNEVVARIRETSLELASAAMEIQALTIQQDEAAQEQAASVRQVSASVSNLAAAADDIASSAAVVLHNAEQAYATTDALVEKNSELDRQVSSIGDLLGLIREIADRSDLLALNGSLEAVRVGEAGRGFALVAAEMRRLAERVTGTVDDVRGRIAQIESAGAGALAATQASRTLVQGTAEAARTISEVTREQSVGAEQASGGMTAVAQTVTAAAAATSQTRAAAEGLRVHATALERLTSRFRLGADVLDGPQSSQPSETSRPR
ncbi:Methyl-accepting chemotaxis protein [Enhygromyxa salina]|uniref:Methyl-accepting chemotaxis protein n=1 Tax=Enhygromyxa salina TaxID=215803 RepID=A0A0C2CX84_9BACT|nr:methyl-accepting chemotaxis protein [Enhygromyxa salina]KIG14210.1 Methyl-accepting chemotaxis protein [Enhygromyxa salina]